MSVPLLFPIVIFRIVQDITDEKLEMCETHGKTRGMEIKFIEFVRIVNQDLVQPQVDMPVRARRGDGQNGSSNRPAAVVRETGIAKVV